jgi:hypothetical protein
MWPNDCGYVFKRDYYRSLADEKEGKGLYNVHGEEARRVGLIGLKTG